MLDFKTPNPLMEGQPFEFWWEHIHGRMCHHQVQQQHLKSVCAEAAPKMKLRAGAKDAMLELARLGIPVTIVSAGITPIILEVLSAVWCLLCAVCFLPSDICCLLTPC